MPGAAGTWPQSRAGVSPARVMTHKRQARRPPYSGVQGGTQESDCGPRPNAIAKKLSNSPYPCILAYKHSCRHARPLPIPYPDRRAGSLLDSSATVGFREGSPWATPALWTQRPCGARSCAATRVVPLPGRCGRFGLDSLESRFAADRAGPLTFEMWPDMADYRPPSVIRRRASPIPEVTRPSCSAPTTPDRPAPFRVDARLRA